MARNIIDDINTGRALRGITTQTIPDSPKQEQQPQQPLTANLPANNPTTPQEPTIEKHENQQPPSIQDHNQGRIERGYIHKNEEDTTQKEEPTHSSLQPAKIEAPYQTLFQKLHKPQSSQDYERNRKKAARQQLIASITDGATAIANMLFTTKGANSTYNPSHQWSDQAKQRYQQLLQDRKAEIDKYNHNLEKAIQLDWQHHREKTQLDIIQSKEIRERALQSILMQQEANKLQQLAIELENKGDLEQAKRLKAQSDQKKAEAEAEIKRVQSLHEEENQNLDKKVKQANINQSNAAANAANASAARTRAQTAREAREEQNREKHSKYILNGIDYKNDVAYQKEITKLAKKQKVPMTDIKGNRRTWNEIAADIEEKGAHSNINTIK